jgi:hypothetical protein
MDYSEDVTKEIPFGGPLTGILGPEDPLAKYDSASAKANWSTSLGYQQRLVGSTTLTPSLSLSGQLKRSDNDPLSQDFVAGPTRMSLGVNLRTDLYGFFPGFGPFEAIRHKVSPGFSFSYAPEVSPTELQRQVFGAAEVGALRTLQISFNQTFEAKRPIEAGAGAAGGRPGEPGARGVPQDSLGLFPGDSLGLPEDSLVLDSLAADTATGPSSQPTSQTFTLLALKTTAINYDFERAKELGDWIWGIKTTTLTNTISSDYLRGLSITMAHDLFDDSGATSGGDGSGSGRKFSPHLSSLNFGFSLDGSSFPFRQLTGLLGGGGQEGAQPAASPTEEEDLDDPFAPTLTDQGSVVPVGGDPAPRARSRGRTGGGAAGSWRADLRFSMQRPRAQTATGNQMLQGTLRFSLTENWDARWRTSYDLLSGSFTDHYIQLIRNLHRWEAHFDFRKTATGNWSFQFEVALLDQEDLHFDYSQRSYQGTTGTRRY